MLKPSLARCFVNGLGQGTSLGIILLLFYIAEKLSESDLFHIINAAINKM